MTLTVDVPAELLNPLACGYAAACYMLCLAFRWPARVLLLPGEGRHPVDCMNVAFIWLLTSPLVPLGVLLYLVGRVLARGHR